MYMRVQKMNPMQALRYVMWLGLRMGRGRIQVCRISHDDGCPCENGQVGLLSCTCEEVWVRVPGQAPLLEQFINELNAAWEED